MLLSFEERRKVDFAVKGCIADLIDKLELAKIETGKIVLEKEVELGSDYTVSK